MARGKVPSNTGDRRMCRAVLLRTTQKLIEFAPRTWRSEVNGGKALIMTHCRDNSLSAVEWGEYFVPNFRSRDHVDYVRVHGTSIKYWVLSA